MLESLVKAGAFDEIATNRAELMSNCDSWLRAISKEADRQDSVGDGIFDLFAAPEEEKPKKSAVHKLPEHDKSGRCESTRRNKRFNPLALETRLTPEKQLFKIFSQVCNSKTTPWSLLEQLNHEKATLGFYMCGHPADLLADDLKEIAQAPICDSLNFLDGDEVPDHKRRTFKIAGIVTMALEKVTKEGKVRRLQT